MVVIFLSIHSSLPNLYPPPPPHCIPVPPRVYFFPSQNCAANCRHLGGRKPFVRELLRLNLSNTFQATLLFPSIPEMFHNIRGTFASLCKHSRSVPQCQGTIASLYEHSRNVPQCQGNIPFMSGEHSRNVPQCQGNIRLSLRAFHKCSTMLENIRFSLQAFQKRSTVSGEHSLSCCQMQQFSPNVHCHRTVTGLLTRMMVIILPISA